MHYNQIYGELVPHFFDQATDFGVVAEFYIYWQDGKDDLDENGDYKIGINVEYLFYLSIAIIILHRVISSVAVYNLTQKPSYAMYQFFDVLMVCCTFIVDDALYIQLYRFDVFTPIIYWIQRNHQMLRDICKQWKRFSRYALLIHLYIQYCIH